MSALAEVLHALSEALDGFGTPWFVFGAQAVALRGAPRATQDVDVTVKVTRSELPDLLARLASQGLHHRYPDLAAELLQDGSVLPLSHRSGMEVDLVLAGSGLEDLALSRATRIDVEGHSIPVAHATDLVVMKVLAGRGKDIDDVRALLATGQVDISEVRDLLGQLEEALGQSDLLPSFERAQLQD